MDEDQGPSQIVPPNAAAHKKTMGDRVRSVKRTFFTREGLVGEYDYGFLFRPNLPFMKRSNQTSPFFGLNDRMPVFLALILGFQHALAMLAGVITPPLILSGASGGVNFPPDVQQYLVSTALIVSGLLTCVQITRFHIRGTPYYVGTGLISVVGISFAIIPVASGAFEQMYANGFCPTAADGTRLPCPDGYGALLGTCALCALLEIAIAFIPPRVILKIFPPIVTGPTVMLIGLYLIKSGFTNWMGGSVVPEGDLPWGSPQYLGLGFSVFATIILCERFGSPIMKSTSVIIGLLVGCIIAAATGYFDAAGIEAAPPVSFVWVTTFRLSIYGPLVLPVMAVFVICACEAIGDITATCDVSRLQVSGKTYETRIQGGVLADGLNGVAAALMTITPVTTFAQNNGVIALTRCANRTAGYCCCLFLVIMGVFAKFAAALVAIPKPVLGGMTTFLFTAVAVSGIAIITRGVPFNRRNRFVLTAGLTLGYAATLVPDYFDHIFDGVQDPSRALQGFLDAISIVMETGFALTAFITMFLNLVLPEEIEETDEKLVVERDDDEEAIKEDKARGGKASHGDEGFVVQGVSGGEGSSMAAGPSGATKGEEGYVRQTAGSVSSDGKFNADAEKNV